MRTALAIVIKGPVALQVALGLEAIVGRARIARLSRDRRHSRPFT